MLKKNKVIAITSPKGGSGKTTTAANLAVVFSLYGKKTLVLDTNIGTASLGLHFGLTNPPVTLKEVIDKNFPITNAIYTYNSKLHVIPSALSIELRYKPATLQERIRRLTDYYDILLTRLVQKYDIVILDTAPGFNAESIAAILASDAIIMVANPDLPSAIAATKGVEYAKLLKRNVLGIVLNRVKHKSYELKSEDIGRSLGSRILSEIPEDENIARAIAHKMPIVDFKNMSKASIAYKKLGAKLLNFSYKPTIFEMIRGIISI
ncbi:AAA family ATPase [Candidatus Woesearchaeota archaeon]|nr:AAA family ATPase [Candidatus Woesearchaeota archaeon]